MSFKKTELRKNTEKSHACNINIDSTRITNHLQDILAIENNTEFS